MEPLSEMAEKLALGPPAGARWGAWRLLERIGEGSTSVVWRARHASAEGRLAALKMAKEGPMAHEALAREALLLARVSRRWGPALLDAGPGFVATEWVEGTPLDAAPRWP